MTNLITPQALQLMLADPGIRIIDARFNLQDPGAGRRAYHEGHIPGALYFDLDKDLSVPAGEHGGRHPLPDMRDFANKLESAGISNSSTVVVYDDGSGVFAGRVWWMLKYAGHTAVQLLDGGLWAWLAAGYDVTTAVPEFAKGVFTLDLQAMTVDMGDVQQALGTGKTILVDARGAERYRGESEPLDKKAGHIPGALNIPYTENVQDGKYKPKDALKEVYKDVLDAEEVILYCGSGVSAAHDILALEEIGVKNVKLYVGSWSDWSSYEENPVATGENA